MALDVMQGALDLRIQEIVPARYVQHAGQLQFEEVLPLEAEPNLALLMRYLGNLQKGVVRAGEGFVQIGFWLNEIRTSEVYRYSKDKDTGLKGYTSFFKFCEEVIGISKSSAQRLMAINTRFCKDGVFINEDCKRFSVTQLSIMATFKNGLEYKLTPEISCRDMERLGRYYSSHDWEVDLKTDWKEDLTAFYAESQANNEYKQAMLRKYKFQSSADKGEGEQIPEPDSPVLCEKPEKPNNPFKKYDVVLAFLDQALFKAEKLSGDKMIKETLDPVICALKEVGFKVRQTKSADIISDL